MAVVKELEEEQQMAPIAVELMDNEMSMVYQKSNKSENDFREHPKIRWYGSQYVSSRILFSKYH